MLSVGVSHRLARSVIHTPDQRVRVFVSSTLGELAEERAVVREAIERLRLSAVMFELGARPHPPRALYRAYLDQSHVFIGIYWQSYGWVAPSETVSGIEDEYEAADVRPKLIYVKAAAGQRDPRLERLLQRIERDDRASYKPFSTAEELRKLVEEDLALLLSERFEASASIAAEWRTPTRPPLPSFPTTFVGREKAIRDIRALFSRKRARLVTLTGPGGIGKTRLAIEVARRVASRFDDGALAVFLAPIGDPNDVVHAIAGGLRLAETPGVTPLESVTAFLRDRKMLLVIDNFEHLLPAAPIVSDVLRACPGVRALVTSRELLKLSGEHGYEVEPLEVPYVGAGQAALRCEAVRLFCHRAVAALPSFSVRADDVSTVADICRRLDGLPLAVELAAARVRLLPVDDIRARLHDRLGLLVHGPRDAPERQRTLRATIAWSHALLPDRERRLFARLGVFRGGWSIDAAQAVCECDGDVLDALSSLVDKSLIRGVSPTGGPLRFTMLETVREFALEQLRHAHEEDTIRTRHAEFFLRSVTEDARAYRQDMSRQRQWVLRVAEDVDNVRAAMRWFLDHRRADAVVAMGMALWDFWWIRSHLREAESWMQEALVSASLSEHERATAEFVAGVAAVGQSEYRRGSEALGDSFETFRRLGDEDAASMVSVPYAVCVALGGNGEQAKAMLDTALATFRKVGRDWQIGYALFSVGRVLMLEGRASEALAAQEEGAARLRAAGELMLRSLTLLNLGWGNLLGGRVERAAEVLAEALGIISSLGNHEGMARALEAIGALALRRGDARRGAVLFGAAEGVRRAIGARPWALDRTLRDPLEANLRHALGDARFRESFNEGAALSVASSVEMARNVVQGAAALEGRGAGVAPVRKRA